MQYDADKRIRHIFYSISPESDIVLCGGDGTLNRFINDSDGYPYENPLYYYGTGSGNDFLRDLGKEQGVSL